MFPLTTTDPASELALKLDVITEAMRMAQGLGNAEDHPEIVAALIHASAMADLAEAIRSAGGELGVGLQNVAACMPDWPMRFRIRTPELRSGGRHAPQAMDYADQIALIQALHRLADALAPLERIAGALEAREPNATPQDATSAPQEPPQPASTTPGGHPLDQWGWIRSRVPTEGDADIDGEVRVADLDGKSWHWLHWRTVAPGQPWAPASADLDSLSTPQPFPAHLAYPTSDGWIHDRVPGAEDADGDGFVGIPGAYGETTLLLWLNVVPGQPWRPIT